MIDQRDIWASVVVLATGAAPALPGLPDRGLRLFQLVEPVRGQIGRTDSATTPTVVRRGGGYVTPSRGGVLIGATKGPGRRDLDPDPAPDVGARLLQAAGPLLEKRIGDISWRVGIRGATPDGLPLASFAGAVGLHLALAPRRNG